MPFFSIQGPRRIQAWTSPHGTSLRLYFRGNADILLALCLNEKLGQAFVCPLLKTENRQAQTRPLYVIRMSGGVGGPLSDGRHGRKPNTRTRPRFYAADAVSLHMVGQEP